MNSFVDSILEPIVWFLADWSIRWAVLIGLLTVWFFVARSRRTAARYLVELTILLAGLLMPLLPRWGGGLVNLSRPSPSIEGMALVGQEPANRSGEALTAPLPTSDENLRPIEAIVRPSVSPTYLPKDENVVPTEPVGTRRIVILSLAGLWMTGVLLYSIRGLAGWLFLRRLRRTAVPADDETIRLMSVCSVELGLNKLVVLAAHPRVNSPITLGLWRPLIVVPLSWPSGAPDARRACLLHELTHVSRRDHWLIFVLVFVETIFWFHPLVRWLLAVIERERELLCDEMVVGRGIEPSDYVQILLAFSRIRGRLMPAVLTADSHPLGFGSRRTLKKRIHHLLEENMTRWPSTLSKRRALALSVSVLALGLGLGGLQLWATADNKARTQENLKAEAEDIPLAVAGDDKEEPAKNLDEEPKRKKREPALRFGGKTFDDWKVVLRIELKPELRKEAIRALTAFGINGYGMEAALVILDAIRGYDAYSEDPDDRIVLDAASRGLVKIGDDAVQLLIKELRRNKLNSRRFAIMTLQQIKGLNRALESAFILACKDEDPVVRGMAISSLVKGYSPLEPTVAALKAALNDPDLENRRAAVQVLLHLGTQTKQFALIVPVLKEALKNEDTNIRVQGVNALLGLASYTSLAVIASLDALKNDRKEVRDVVLGSLGSSGLRSNPKLLVSSYIKLLEDKDFLNRGSVIEQLRSLGSAAEEAVPVLLKELREGDRVNRVAIVDTLQYLTSLRAAATNVVPVLLDEIKNGDKDNRGFFIRTLGSIGPAAKEAIPVLSTLLNDENPNVRKSAADALQKVSK